MTSIGVECATSATMAICPNPGFSIGEPYVPAKTAAAAIAGCTPAPIRTGIKMAPTAAEQPPALVIEVFTSAVAEYCARNQ